MDYRKLKDLNKLEGNPRIIKDDDFQRLCTSIKANPDYFEARPLILSSRTGQLVIIAGNQRYEAAKHLGLKEVPTYLIGGLTEEREREIIIRDNVNNGQWDWDALANNWEAEELKDWGVDVPVFEDEPTGDDLIGDEKNKPEILKITFTSQEQLQQAEIDIIELINRKYQGAYVKN
jgi:ParB-like chromosome segregation protein Spo0J